MQFASGKYGIGTYGVISYHVYVKEGEAPDPDVDVAVASVGTTVTSADLDVAWPGNGGEQMFGVVVPVNEQGIGLPGAPFSFAFDGAGDVEAMPTPVTRLRAVPKPGGYVDVSWSYRDAGLVLKATAFQVVTTFEPDVGESSAGFVTVQREGPRSEYVTTLGPLGAGLLTVKVISLSATLSGYSDVQSVRVRVDPDAPADKVLVLQAV